MMFICSCTCESEVISPNDGKTCEDKSCGVNESVPENHLGGRSTAWEICKSTEEEVNRNI